MSTLTFSGRSSLVVGALLGLAACGSATPGSGAKSAEVEAAADADKISCQVNGATGFERVCAVERASGPDGLELTLRHPEGGFRRLLVTKDGRGVIAADGAATADVQVIDDGEIEVALDGDRYRLPATVNSK